VPAVRFALPIALIVCLAAVFILSPRREPRRLRERSRHLAGQLQAQHGFREDSKASWAQTRSTGWPPFHYGGHGDLDGVLAGEVDDLPVRVAGYEVRFNSSRHRYGLALIVPPYRVEWMEVRGERPFSAAQVAEHVPDGQVKQAVQEFDAHWSVFAEANEVQRPVGSQELVRAMLDAPTRFSWRTEGGEVLLWKRDGWRDAHELLASIRCVTGLLGLARPDRHAAA
jgi:hypothetical protein